jgi:lipoyl(octanoyl) transferase
MAGTNINIIDCGLKDYQSILQKQLQLHEKISQGSGNDTVIIVEHQPVITLGARNSANKLSKDEDTIKKDGIEIFQIRRGGGTTAHNPGQLVIYPIINLKKYSLGVSDFVHLLENIGIEFLAELGVKCETKKGLPGLWVLNDALRLTQPIRASHLSSVALAKEEPQPFNATNDKKIASIGVQIKKWITIHGMAININNDLSIFDLIVPCGLENVKMTSVEKELGKKINMDDTKNTLKKILLKHFTG